MPNTKNVKKRVAKTVRRTIRNKSRKSEIKTYEKKFRSEVEGSDLESAEKLLNKVTSLYDKAAKSKIIHQNRAHRKKSRLKLALNKAKSASK